MHFANNEEDKKDDRLFKIRKILNEVQDTYMAAYKSHKELDLETNPSEDSLPSSESYQHYNQACVFPRRHQPLLWGVSCEESADRSVCLHHMPACTETE
ncbi:hypothetical protein Pcinc_002679 [Petrolisthes cinctipes]|uniref:Uncharacterized protein n=1 Tax=Petrolisthes cinctipes TaxID=88211 RepID=A0AAE1GPW6_PETCI|nr:hypothetical protein Pcinc_002679 [Petrolisthes cinctipes]